MNFRITNDKNIIIDSTEDFVPKHITECGQIFRYKSEKTGYKIFTQNMFCSLIYDNTRVIIETSDADYFVDFFDLNTDYSDIKNKLSGYPKLKNSLEFGSGIRILRQNPLEMIISFIISANNNIPRIKKTIESLCDALGEDMGGYHAFPTIEALASADEKFFTSIGAGYRAKYLVSASEQLLKGYANGVCGLSTQDARKYLKGIMGVGDKVADCILLFGYHRTDTFPVDVWTERVYNNLFGDDGLSRAKKSERLTQEFGNLSGYAQQYLFYYTRENQIKN